MEEKTAGVWVTYFYDGPAHFTAAFDEEITALRWGFDHNQYGVVFVPFGIEFIDALEAKNNPQRG